MELIDKAALYAEIKRLLAFYLKEIENNKEDPWAMDIAKRDILQEILSFIDTLKVKEVDLKKEIGKYLDANDIEFGYQIKLVDFAKHFFELGLKVTQKGE